MLTRMQQRRGTQAEWNDSVIASTVILQAGELGLETDTGRFKIGNGVTVWQNLPYYLPDNNSSSVPARQGKNNQDIYSRLSPLAPTYTQNFTGAQVLVPQSGSQTPLVVSGVTGQSTVLQRWRDANDATLASIDQTGKLTTANGALFNANVDMNNHRVVNVATPTGDNDAANKLYVDGAIAGLAWKEAVQLIAHGTGSNVALTGNTGTLVVDGHAPLVQADSGIYRLLLTGQTTASQNGIYLYTDNGTTYTLTRTTDADNPLELVGATVYVQEGTTYGTSSWVQSNYEIDAFEEQVWVQFSGAALITAGLGMTKDGNVLDVNGTADRITANADSIDIAATYVGQTSITTLGTIGTGTWNASVIDETVGGTGQSSYAVGDILYADTTTSLNKLTSGTAGTPLLAGGANTAPSYGQVPTAGIADDAVTLDKIQNIPQYRVLGRITAGSGNTQELNSDELMTIINLGNNDISFNLLPTTTSGGNNGTAETVARGDHTHTIDNLSDVQISGTPALRQVIKYDGTKWINELPSGGISVGSTPPNDASAGDAWFDSTDGSLYVYYDDTVGSPARTNLITNPSFETNTSGWLSAGSSVTRDTSQFYSGTASARIQSAGPGDSSIYFVESPFTPTISATAGQTYTFSIYVKQESGSSTAYVSINWRNSSNDSISSNSSSEIATNSSGWTRVTLTATAPANTAFAVPSIFLYGKPAYIDAALFEQSGTANEYIEGTTPSGSSAQWVQVKANSALEASILTRLSAVESRTTKLEGANAIRVLSMAERDAAFPAPVQGNTVFRADLGYEQKYFEAYDPVNVPDGTNDTPGWYQVTAPGTVSQTNGTVTTASTSSGVVRNIYISTSDPSGGMDGDVWIKYTE